MTAESWVCPDHGPYGDDRHIWSDECKACRDQRQQDEHDFDQVQYRYDWWRLRSGIPLRYRAATAAGIKPVSPAAKQLAAAVGSYTANLEHHLAKGRGFVLLGPPGVGKTVALAATISAACALIRGPRYVSWPDALAEVKAGYGGPRDDPRREAIAQLHDAPLLAVDELGVRESASDFDHAQLFALIDHRYCALLPTLVAANATPGNFAALVGERIADRLLEQGPTIALSGASQRGKVTIDGPDALEPPDDSLVTRSHRRGEWITSTRRAAQ